MSKAKVANSHDADWREEPLVAVTPPKTFWAGTKYSFQSILAQRSLIDLLIRREIKARYKDSSLGLVWSLAKPLVQLLIYYVAVGKFLGAARAIPDFAIFVFSGLTAWALFSEIITSTTGSIIGNAGLIKKVYLPREIFPIAATGSAIFNFAVQLVVLLFATLVLGQFPLSWDAYYAVLGAAVLLLFAFAVGLLLSALTVYLRDIQHLVEVLLLVLFWASPIVYSYKFVNEFLQGNFFEQLYLANPITLGVMGFQRGMWISGAQQIWPDNLELRLIIAGLVCLGLIWISQRIFSRLEGNFAQEI